MQFLVQIVNNKPYVMLIEIQPDATVCRYFIYCTVTLHVSGVTAPIIRSTKNCNRNLRYRS